VTGSVGLAVVALALLCAGIFVGAVLELQAVAVALTVIACLVLVASRAPSFGGGDGGDGD
jgi:hypothetical protein